MRITAFSLIVPDYEAGIAFFVGGLGFSLTADIDQGHKRWVTVAPAGSEVQIVLARAENPRQTDAVGNQAGGRVWLFLQTKDFAADQARLIAAGAVFEETPRHEPYGIVAVWRDPWGNRWDLIQPA